MTNITQGNNYLELLSSELTPFCSRYLSVNIYHNTIILFSVN